ncbi:ribonuclease 3 [Hyposmocoma kahamanoa]|uniref:ribonuclease 3 n=1 Tax=Hyposmocoma kahamanoa TaxID=1477025 RepID=UPI000E6D903A|nr:ribonuclease 3 [Hyposmocoma kahamanoa]
MSIPPVNYSVPPPNLNVPPPGAPPLRPTEILPPPLYSHPPPFTVPLVSGTEPPYMAVPTLPPLNMPPPATAYPSPPVDIHTVPPPFLPPVASEFSYREPGYYPKDSNFAMSFVPPKLEVKSERDSPCPSDRSYYSQKDGEPSTSKDYEKKYSYIKEEKSNRPSSQLKTRMSPPREYDRGRHDREYSKGRHYDKDDERRRYEKERERIEREKYYDRERSYDRERRERHYRESKARDHRCHSPSYSHRSRSPSRHSYRDMEKERERERYYREKYYREKYEERRELERRRYEYEHRRSLSRDHRSHSRSHYDAKCERVFRSPSRRRYSREREYSSSRSGSIQESLPRKKLTDREKILEEYRKNYCKTSEDFIEKLEQWQKDHNSDEEESSTMWYRSSPAELYYKPVEDGQGVQQTLKLEKLCDNFFKELIERGRKARPVGDELPPLKPPKAKMCKHRLEEGSSSSSESDDECLDEDGLQGYTDRIMLELQRKQSHPRRLHPELWFNNTGEMNGGPLCRCSARARRHGMRHGVYAGEDAFTKCIPTQSNINKLYHYRITVSPPTNFLIKSPTIIGHDEHEFLFSGFSMFSHYKLAKLPKCKVIRFNIEYTILYVEEPAPQNFTIRELDLFEEYLFYELLELIDLDLGKATESSCSQFHFMPRFVRFLPEGGCEIIHRLHVHLRYQKAWRYYVKYRHLIANMAKPSFKDRQKLAAKEAKLQEMRTQSKMKRDVTVAISSEGFHTTGLMCDVVQHAMLIPVLVRHLRFHKLLDSLERKIGYVFKQRLLLQTALTHPSYRENFGTNPDHARNSLTNCGIRQPEYGDRRIHYTRKKGIVTLINIMSRFGKHSETESEIKHNERLEFLGDAVVEFLSSIHLFRMFPGLAEGGLATYRAAIVQNQHLAQLAKNIELEQFMLYAHGSDLCREVVMRHAMANCFEALMGALFLDAGLQVADRVFSLALWYKETDLLDVWTKERAHPLQEQEPLGDRKYIKDFEFLQKLTEFEESIGVQFKHIRLLARAFTDRSVGFTHLTLGSNQRLEFLGDTVLQLVVSDRLYRHFPDHHEGHLSLLRSSLVNKRTQAMVCDDLNMSAYAIYNNPKAKPTTKKHKADLLEAFLGALYIDKNLDYCQVFCNACLFPRLQEFIMNQDWNDPKSKLQQCCLTLRSMEGGEPDIPLYKVIECLGPTNTRVYTVGVYFRGARLAAARGHSIQEAEMNAAEEALNSAHELFPQLDHQKRVIAKSMKKKNRRTGRDSPHTKDKDKRSKLEDRVPKAYRLDKDDTSSSDESLHLVSDEEAVSAGTKSDEDSGLDSDTTVNDKLQNVQVSSLLSDMERLKEDLIKRNEYEKLKEKCKKSDSEDD